MSYTRLLYHIVFRPYNSEPVIDEAHEEDLYKYLWGFVKNKNGLLYCIGGMPNHVHMFVQLPATISLSSFMHDLKLAANKYMSDHKDKFPLFRGWGKSYCALSCSESIKDKVICYIKNQKAHHKKMGFHDELLSLLRKSGVDVNMDYFLKE